MGFFNFREKSSRSFAAILAFFGAGQPITEMDRNYESIAKEGYAGNPIVMACIKLIAEAFAELEPTLYERTPDGIEKVDSHPVLQLLNDPNPLISSFEWRVKVMSYLLLSGDSYLQSVARATGPQRGQPMELWPLRPDRMEIKAGTWMDPIRSYLYTAHGQEETFSDEEIMHSRLFHPLDEFYGLSPLQAAALAVDSHNSSSRWTFSTMRNGGVPPFIVNIKGQVTDEVRDQFKRTVLLNSQENSGQPLVLEGADGITVEKLGRASDEMESVDTKKLFARNICAVYNVPPQMVGVPDSETYSNFETARKALYTEAVIPDSKLIYQAYNKWLLPKYNDPRKLFFGVNTQGIDALQEEKGALYERVIAAWDSGLLTQRQAVKMLGESEDAASDEYKFQLRGNELERQQSAFSASIERRRNQIESAA